MTPSAPATGRAIAPLIENRSSDWIPGRGRHGKVWHQGPLWFWGNFQYFSVPIRPIEPKTIAQVVTILVLAVAWCTIATSIGSVSVATVFSALTLMLYILLPWCATNLADFFIVRKGHYAIEALFTPTASAGCGDGEVWRRSGWASQPRGLPWCCPLSAGGATSVPPQRPRARSTLPGSWAWP